MRNFEIVYTILGETKTERIKARSGTRALRLVLDSIGRRQVFFQLVNIRML